MTHGNARVAKLWSHDHICNIIMSHVTKFYIVSSWIEIVSWQSLFQNTDILRRPGVANFTDLKIAITLIKTTFKNRKLCIIM